ncbi:Swi3-domain-containing protein [Hypoxylon cercidicola]|nr:Swi3-domain-containing protein [Hypoxylon cercidicola]
MASRTASKPPSGPKGSLNNDIDNYDVDDIFGELDNEVSNSQAQSKKRKDAPDLGIDEAVAIKKKPRDPIVKLDESRLLSEKGIPRLRRKASDLKFKGKGHEFSDAAKLLSFYQLWFDDLFPKAKFLDAAAMAEKAGHKKYMRMKRMEWINEGKPKPAGLDEEDEDLFGDSANQPEERAPAIFPARVAPIFQTQEAERPQTPTRDDVPDDDDDFYNATPLVSRTAQPANTSTSGNGGNAAGGSSKSLFGNGGEPDEDDLDALMAEEEAQRPNPPTSLFGNGGSKAPQQHDEPDEDDLDALMAEAEAETQPKPSNSDSSAGPRPVKAPADDDVDDLDALMAEAENQPQAREFLDASSSKPKEATDAARDIADADEEAAMAEIDGLW